MIDLLQDLAELNHHLKAIICETLSNPDYKAQYIRDGYRSLMIFKPYKILIACIEL